MWVVDHAKDHLLLGSWLSSGASSRVGSGAENTRPALLIIT